MLRADDGNASVTGGNWHFGLKFAHRLYNICPNRIVKLSIFEMSFLSVTQTYSEKEFLPYRKDSSLSPSSSTSPDALQEKCESEAIKHAPNFQPCSVLGPFPWRRSWERGCQIFYPTVGYIWFKLDTPQIWATALTASVKIRFARRLVTYFSRLANKFSPGVKWSKPRTHLSNYKKRTLTVRHDLK